MKDLSIPYRETFRVRSYEADLNNRVKISTIFNFMQETASMNAIELKFGFDDLAEDGLFWVLSRAKIVMNNYPDAFEFITVDTWPKNLNKLFANRDFRFFDKDMKCIGAATTAWLMVKRKNLKPVNPETNMIGLHQVMTEPGIDEVLEKIPEDQSRLLFSEFEIGYKDIDINQHTNNSRYIEYLQDCLNEEFCSGKLIKAIQVNFLSQTKSGDIIKLYRTESNDRNIIYADAENQNGKKVFNSIISFTD